MLTSSTVMPNIVIQHHSHRELQLTEYALSKISSKPIGLGLLSEINLMANGETKIRISPGEKCLSATVPILTDSQAKRFKNVTDWPEVEWNESIANQLCGLESIGGGEEGTSVIVQWRTDEYVDIDHQKRSINVSNENLAFITLAHELVHAYWVMKGESLVIEPDMNGVGYQEENRAMGINKFLNDRYTENNIRLEHGLPFRFTYHSFKA